jgi:Lipopolysaccharide-assembly
MHITLARGGKNAVLLRREAASARDRFSFGSLALLLTAFCVLPSFLACGYHVAGGGNRLPPDVKTIAVPIFTNESPRFRIEQMVAEAVTREFMERTSYRITANPREADAVLRGTIKDVRSGVVTFDLNTGRATTMQIQVTADVKLVDTHSKKVLFSNSNYIFREQYQINPSSSGQFEEDQPALRRLSQDLARTLVTEIVENF